MSANEEQLRAALVKAVECIQTWHNMGIPQGERSDLWDIYWRNAPEMKLIREALMQSHDMTCASMYADPASGKAYACNCK